jgi:hypothetical protein
VTAGEAGARHALGGRARGWLAAYSILGAAGLAAARPARIGRRLPGALWLGLPLAFAGYPLGCRLLGHRGSGRPPDSRGLELAALAALVAPAEELIWGGQVEPRIGIIPTALLFAAKHVIIDGRWRRGLGLAAFWCGLGLVRSRSPRIAAAVHVAANAGGVLLGHATGRDQF